MTKLETEMVKGTLEGSILASLSGQPAYGYGYGYEITARLREQGFSDMAEGTIHALLIRMERRALVEVEKAPSEKGPPRKVHSLNAQGREHLEEFRRTWSFLTERLEQLREGEGEQPCPTPKRPASSLRRSGPGNAGGRTRRASGSFPGTTARRSRRSSGTRCTSCRPTAGATRRCSKTSPACSNRPR